VGSSASFGGKSVWIFGDTFFAEPAVDGYRWRGSSWSYTDDGDASDGLTGWTHALGADGKPLAALPHTALERMFDDAHNGMPCPAMNDCGARHTVWPSSLVVDPTTGMALIFYSAEHTEPTGSFAFNSVGHSIATWASITSRAIRPEVNAVPSDPTLLFGADEPSWGDAATIDGGWLYAFACQGGGLSAPCRVARVPVGLALDRGSWTFWNGVDWEANWRHAAPVFSGGVLGSVHYSPYLKKFVAYYVTPLKNTLNLRTSSRPEGPWSDELAFGEGAAPLDGTWDYGLFAHPELAGNGGKSEYVSYFQPGVFLDGVIHLVEVTYP
jgi:hypothetical protein